MVAALGHFPRKGKAVLQLQILFGMMVILFSVSRVLWFSLLTLFLAGIALIAVFALIGSLVQLQAPEALRGRVMSIYMIAFRGGMPLGSLVTGFLASHLSPSLVLAGNGILLSLVAGIFLWHSGKISLDQTA